MINEKELKTIETDLLQSKSLVRYQQADLTERAAMDALIQEIDLNDTHSLLYFGAPAQQQLASISDDMLEGVRNKDTGPAGEALNRMLVTVRGFDLGSLDPNSKPGIFARLLGKTRPVTKFLQRYEEVRDQIDAIGDDLERHKTQLLTDIVSLDRLYAANLEYFHHLERYIVAGEEKLRQLDEQDIPALEREAAESEAMVAAQQLRDLRANRDALERRVHDLKLTRQVAMQSLPSIRLVQENDKGLINKIVSTTANTLPLWRQQLAQAVTIHRSREAVATIRSASDLTNELLKANAENLKQGNAEARREIERGVFDIDAVKQANASLIETIEESLSIADEGRRKRAEAALQLETLEAELRRTLVSASARVNARPGQ
ncbi:MAG: toxic anion resistance protein [Proteobacteria bacterium]|nr:toxic anion resistance protein [Desulfocapsa sp.]MBU3944357.1 toxic anion resistance protein [Pseudomonadota bacterium]MCG2742625.1 toxic anion resistance protein [Desulfobacteraceae bacterium]MBU3983828.1 toxic anion resistance protein [Pseudomonadota bacterium]MBU4029872.1 toxic anion resistance protein [Pseudomonadota bacterium]